MRRLAIISTLAFFLMGTLSLGAVCLRVKSRIVPSFAGVKTESIRGAFHVHSKTSHDGKLSIDEIAIAARQADIDFVILTDHNVSPAPPVIQRGVLFLKFSEWSTAFGHVIQLKGSPLAQEDKKSLEVLNTIRNNNGLAIIAHPFDMKRPWVGPWEGLVGLEIANSASALRQLLRDNIFRIVPMLAGFFMHQDLTWGQLYSPNTRALKRWQSEAQSLPIGMCGVDLHGWIETKKNLNLWNLVLPGPLPEQIDDQVKYVLEKITHGSFYCSSAQNNQPIQMRTEIIDAQGKPLLYDSTLLLENPQALNIYLQNKNAETLRIVLYRNGQRLMTQPGPTLSYQRPGPGIYRVEIETDYPKLLEGHYRATLAYSNLFNIIPSQSDSSAEANE